MRIRFLIIATVLIGFNKVSLSQNNFDTRFDWLVGKWEAKTKEGMVYEYWDKTALFTLEAKGGELVRGDTVFKELVTLIKINEYWCYIPIVGKQNPIIFTLRESNTTKFIFENKEHDFPQKITYERIDSLHFNARVEGKINGKEMQEEYKMTKVK